MNVVRIILVGSLTKVNPSGKNHMDIQTEVRIISRNCQRERVMLMSREKEGYRDTMELLNERYPDKDMLTVNDVARFIGVSRNSVKKKIRFNEATNRVSKCDLARQVCV